MKTLSISTIALISVLSASAAFANNNTYQPTQNADAYVGGQTYTRQSDRNTNGAYASAPAASQDVIIGHHSNN